MLIGCSDLGQFVFKALFPPLYLTRGVANPESRSLGDFHPSSRIPAPALAKQDQLVCNKTSLLRKLLRLMENPLLLARNDHQTDRIERGRK